MRDQIFPATFESAEFHCPFCAVYAHQSWGDLGHNINGGRLTLTGNKVSKCGRCNKLSYWIGQKMIFPSTAPVEQAHPDLPAGCVPEYEEAMSVVMASPRAAAALLRLMIQKLMIELGEKGKNINDDIAALVKKGLTLKIQQALDVCRVVGNNAVHPGSIDLNDTPELTTTLFRLVNLIVEEMITKPKEVDALYNSLPPEALAAIAKRDASKTP